MAQKYVGVDIGSHHIKVVVVSAGLRGVQVVDAFAEPVGPLPSSQEGEEPPDPFSHLLGAAFGALRSHGLLGQTIGVCLPPRLLSYRVLSFPFSDERRIAQAVSFEVDGHFATPIEELAHGHVAVPSTEGGGRALVVGLHRDRLQQVATLFRRSGSELKVLTSSALAAGQVAHVSLPAPGPDMVEQGRKPAALLVDLGHEYTHFVALGAKGPLAVRAVRRGGRQISEAIAHAYGLNPDEAEAAKQTDAFLPHHGLPEISQEQMQAGKVVAEAFEPILRELEHTRLWLRSTYHLEVSSVQLLGGGAELNGVAGYLSEHTGLDVAAFEAGATGLKVPAGMAMAGFAGALGAAYGAARRPLVHLRDTRTGDTDTGWVQQRMSSLIAIGIAVMGFAALDTIAQVKATDAALAAHKEELDAASQSAFGQALTPAEVTAKLSEAEGQDLTSLVPERGALETMAMIVKAVTPTDLATAPGMPAAGGQPASPGAAPSEEAEEEGDQAEETEKSTTAPAGAGIVVADNLIISTLDIRELKIEVKAEAAKGSAQDRLAREFGKIDCISNLSKGKVRGVEPSVSFQMTMDSRCYYKSIVTEEAEEED